MKPDMEAVIEAAKMRGMTSKFNALRYETMLEENVKSSGVKKILQLQIT